VLSKTMNPLPTKPRMVNNMLRLAFICVENSNRSQMAQAFARMLGGDQVEAYSAGSHPSGKINPRAIAAMQELNYDLTTHTSKSISELPDLPYDAAITMGCGDSCPHLQARLHEDWSLPDPRNMPPEEFNCVRDAIRTRVADLLTRLELKS
jgi:arsenate reductase (thioredoxin)